MAKGLIEYSEAETDLVTMLLSVDGIVVLSSPNPDSIVRKASLMQLEELSFSEGFRFELPAGPDILREAEEAYFMHRPIALRIITALIWVADFGRYTGVLNRRRPRVRLKGLARRRELVSIDAIYRGVHSAT